MSYNSKYSGQQVESLLDQVANGNTGGSGGGGGITTELDPIFSASPAAKITDENITSWNNKVDKVDGKQLSTEDFTTALKNKLSGLNNYDDTAINQAVQSLQTQLNTLVSGNANDAINSFNEIIAFLDGVKDNQDLSSIIASIEQQIASKMDKVTLAAVATSGNYNDLSNKPTIPTAVTESTVSGWGFTKNKGTYSKPSTGIPKTDLASAVQTSLGKADTALQSEQYKGTVTSVKINGTTKTPDANGMVDLGTIEGGGSNTYIFDWDGSSTSGSLTEELFNKAMSAESIIVREVKGEKVEIREAEYISKEEQIACGFTIHYITSSTRIRNVSFILQSTTWIAVVSDINIPSKTSELTNNSNFVTSNNLKTINGESILGSGDIVISGGSSSGGSGAYAEVNHGTGDTTFALTPNTFHVWDEVVSLDLSFADKQSGVANEYLFQFTSGATPTSLTLPDTIQWVNGAPNIEANKTYQASIVNNIGLIVSV